LFDNDGAETGNRFAGLEAVFDPISRRHIESTGLVPGRRAGSGRGRRLDGSMLAEPTGPEGGTLATDVNLDWIAPTRMLNLVMRRPDVVGDPIAEPSYELVTPDWCWSTSPTGGCPVARRTS
jgi:hypothetical protein